MDNNTKVTSRRLMLVYQEMQGDVCKEIRTQIDVKQLESIPVISVGAALSVEYFEMMAKFKREQA